MNTDGNLAALNVYLREQDAIYEGDAKLESMIQDLAIEMYEAYVTGNHSVIDEVDDRLTDTDVTDNLITKLREALKDECRKPVNERGAIIYKSYDKLIEEACWDIARRCMEPDDFDWYRREFGL